jgi:hypothetical protein
LPVKAIDKQRPVLRVLPMERPVSVDRDIYAETQPALLNAYNMIESMLNKNMTAVINNIRPENINDIVKLSNALSSLGRTAVEVERWEYQKNTMLKEAVDYVKSEIRGLLETKHPELMDELVRVLEKHGGNEDSFAMQAQISSRLHRSQARQLVDEGDE